jgi:hypothetical protein
VRTGDTANPCAVLTSLRGDAIRYDATDGIDGLTPISQKD